MNEKTKLINRRIELAQADPPALFVLAPGAAAEDLDAALRIISEYRHSDLTQTLEKAEKTAKKQ